MSRWMIILLAVSTIASIWLAIWFVQNRNDERPQPPIPIPEEPERIVVLAGSANGVDLLLRPYSAEPGQDAFHREQIRRLLGEDGEGLEFLRVWVRNRGEAALPFAAGAMLRMTRRNDASWQGGALAELVDQVRNKGDLDPGASFVLEGLARGDLKELASGGHVEALVALPRRPDWRDLDDVILPGLGPLALQRSEAVAAELESYLLAPRGELMGRLVLREDVEPAMQARRNEEMER